MTFGAAAIKRGTVQVIKRRAFAQATRKVGFGDEGATESDQVHALSQCLISQRCVVAVIHHPGIVAVGVAVVARSEP